MSTDTLPLVVPAKEAARMLAIGESTLWRLSRAGKVPAPVKIGSATRWRIEDLRRHLGCQASQPTSASTPAAA